MKIVAGKALRGILSHMHRNPPRVLLVITKGSWGGATRYVYDLARGLKEKGHAVAVAYGDEGPLEALLHREDIRTFRISGLTRNIGILREFRALYDLLRCIRKWNPDIVHVNSSKGGIGACAGRLLGKRVVFTTHGWAFNERRPLLAKLILKAVYFFILILSHATIAVSDAVARPVEQWPFVRKKIHRITLGIDASRRVLSAKEAKEELVARLPQLQKHKEKRWLLTIAELHDSKGVDVMLAGLVFLKKRYRDSLHYVIIGEGEERRKLESLVTSYEIGDMVSFAGFVPDASRLLSAGEVFALPSRTEALGYVLLEAGLAGVPVVASRVGGVPEVLEHDVSGILVSAESPSALETAIVSLLEDTARGKRYAAALKQRVENNFSLARMIQKTQELYDSVLDSKKSLS